MNVQLWRRGGLAHDHNFCALGRRWHFKKSTHRGDLVSTEGRDQPATWSGPGKDGRPTRYVTGEVLRVEAPTLLESKFGMGDGAVMSRVKVALTQETEAVKVVVTNDAFADDDPAYLQNATGGRGSSRA